MSKTKCLILQSGYLTPEVLGLLLPPVHKTDISVVIIKPFRQFNREYYYAVDMDKLYQAYMADNNLSRNFEFRERYLKEAVRLFDTISFKDWVMRQIDSPMLNDTNSQFLLDTFNYILGNQRSIDVVNWIGLVESTPGNVDRTKLKALIDCYFGVTTNHAIYSGPTLPASLTEVIAMWTSRPSGTRDFMVSMGIIFGDHRRPEIVGAGQSMPSSAVYSNPGSSKD